MCSQLLGVLMSNAETTNHCSAPWSNLEIFVFSLKCFVVRARMRTRLPRSPSASWCHQSTTFVFIAVWIFSSNEYFVFLNNLTHNHKLLVCCPTASVDQTVFMSRRLCKNCKTVKMLYFCSILPACSCFWRRKLSSSLSAPTIPSNRSSSL